MCRVPFAFYPACTNILELRSNSRQGYSSSTFLRFTVQAASLFLGQAAIVKLTSKSRSLHKSPLLFEGIKSSVCSLASPVPKQSAPLYAHRVLADPGQ